MNARGTPSGSAAKAPRTAIARAPRRIQQFCRIIRAGYTFGPPVISLRSEQHKKREKDPSFSPSEFRGVSSGRLRSRGERAAAVLEALPRFLHRVRPLGDGVFELDRRRE